MLRHTILLASLLFLAGCAFFGAHDGFELVFIEGMNPGECSDGADNDEDGLLDCADPDCIGAPDCFEEIVDDDDSAGDDDDSAGDDDDSAGDDDDSAGDDDDSAGDDDDSAGDDDDSAGDDDDSAGQ